MTAQLILEGLPGGAVYYDRRIANYRFQETDNPVPRSFIDSAVREEQKALLRKIQLNTSMLIRGNISLAVWEENVAAEFRRSGIAVVIAVAGGIENITTSPGARFYWRMFGINLKGAFSRIERIATKLAMGDLTEAQLNDRLDRISLELLVVKSRTEVIRSIIGAGFNEAKRSLNASKPGRCPQCSLHSTEGLFIPIESVMPVGHACLGGGRCSARLDFRFNPELPQVSQETIARLMRSMKEASDQIGLEFFGENTEGDTGF